ncbi:MAG TPA: aminopeptidase P family protein, partial [Solirubrobacterales bacterium]
GLDMLLVADLVHPGDSVLPDPNLRWLTGFSGSSGAAIVGPGVATFVTDFRYIERVREELGGFEISQAERQLVPAVAKLLRGRVGFDEAHTSVKVFEGLQEELDGSVDLVRSAGLVERLRRVKDEVELERMREAARLADQAVERVLEPGLAGRTEREVAGAYAAAIRELGCEPSFAAIVAAGPNGALPHATPSDRVIGEGELVVFDHGAIYEGYCSDGTRTFAAGEPDEESREVYDLVKRAQQAGLEAVRAGAIGRAVDAVARDLISAEGHGEDFGHGLGHGVGVEVHEAPRLGQRSDDVLEAGNVVTVEPGVYVAGRVGVRIEDVGVVTEGGYENFSLTAKGLRVVG